MAICSIEFIVDVVSFSNMGELHQSIVWRYVDLSWNDCFVNRFTFMRKIDRKGVHVSSTSSIAVVLPCFTERLRKPAAGIAADRVI